MWGWGLSVLYRPRSVSCQHHLPGEKGKKEKGSSVIVSLSYDSTMTMGPAVMMSSLILEVAGIELTRLR